MTTATKERPVLFSGAMVSAILRDSKTQTRRVIKPQPPEGFLPWNYNGALMCIFSKDGKSYPEVKGCAAGDVVTRRCPYGAFGDQLWVREAWSVAGNGVFYRADTAQPETVKYAWNSPRFMMRKDSRLLLGVTGVRVQRVQEIGEEDALAEGIEEVFVQDGGKHSNLTPSYIAFPEREGGLHTARAAFEMLWDSINAKRGFGWDVNPWVWVVEFKRVH